MLSQKDVKFRKQGGIEDTLYFRAPMKLHPLLFHSLSELDNKQVQEMLTEIF